MSTPSCWKILTRKKILSIEADGAADNGKLGRILNTYDLTALGVGATLGVGVYVLAGHVSKDQAGPSVVLSFLIAAAASFLAGMYPVSSAVFSEAPQTASIPSTSKQAFESSNLLRSGGRLTGSAFMRQLFNVSCVRIPSHASTSVVGVLVTLYCLVSLALSLTIFYAKQPLYDMEPWALTLAGTLLGLLLLILLLMSIQPRETAEAPFKVPFVPLLPAISIFVNIYLMLMLDVYTWIRFGIWMGIGLALYAFYGFRNSYRDVYSCRPGWTKLKYGH
ncbi:AAEL012133-PA [Aedes aegypti]|uniref:AAEL012133-PA n=1 Tax=Aedes aegypti TaxID=7159 RepID=Q16N04_AEDAE|nr:AAEL012133-PA [Aedes aegypti]